MYQKVDFLILDEWLLKPLTTQEAMDLFEIIEDRTLKGAMIFCTQFDPRGWYERIGSLSGTVSDTMGLFLCESGSVFFVFISISNSSHGNQKCNNWHFKCKIIPN
jgi:hypothetical protein